MAYESKVIIVDAHKLNGKVIWAERIADVRLSCMGYNNGWRELFDKPIEYKLFMEDGDTEFDEDNYGEHMKSCPVDRVVDWLEKEMQESNYRRLPMLYGLLKGFDQSKWENLEVVHFGY